MRPFIIGTVVTALTFCLGARFLRWRRQRQEDQPVTARWLNENAYDRDGDDRQWK